MQKWRHSEKLLDIKLINKQRNKHLFTVIQNYNKYIHLVNSTCVSLCYSCLDEITSDWGQSDRGGLYLPATNVHLTVSKVPVTIETFLSGSRPKQPISGAFSNSEQWKNQSADTETYRAGAQSDQPPFMHALYQQQQLQYRSVKLAFMSTTWNGGRPLDKLRGQTRVGVLCGILLKLYL